jgi:hypothetical protein
MEILMDDKEKSEEEFKKRYQHPAFKGKKPCKRCTLYPAYQSSEYCPNCDVEVTSEYWAKKGDELAGIGEYAVTGNAQKEHGKTKLGKALDKVWEWNPVGSPLFQERFANNFKHRPEHENWHTGETIPNRGYEITKTNSSAIENIEKIDDGMERMKAYQFLYQQIWIKLEKLIEENKGNG